LLTEPHLELLTLIDGRTDGHALLRARPGWSEAWLLRALGGLYRASLLGFAP
jgi:hypothetical protein